MRIISETGVPVVAPSNTPDRISTRSGSRRCVVNLDWPGLRRSSQCWISAAAKGMREGTPSTTTPMAGPWLSPQVVNLNSSPNEEPAMSGRPGHERLCHEHGQGIRTVVAKWPDLAITGGAVQAQRLGLMDARFEA